MPGIGVIVNVITVVIGGVIGTIAGDAVPGRMRDGVVKAAALGVIVIGVSGAFKGLSGLGAHGGLLGQYGILVFVGSLVVGAFIGEAMRLEDWLERFGHWLNSLFVKGSLAKQDVATKGLQTSSDNNPLSHAESLVETSSNDDSTNEPSPADRSLVEGFMTASLIYCVGAMTVLGSIQDGLGNPNTLYIKALLDGVISIFLASSLGIGVALSAVTIFILQGSIAAVAYFAGDIIPAIAVTGVEAVGGALIMGIGLNFVLKKRLPVGNMLPAVFVAFALCWMLG